MNESCIFCSIVDWLPKLLCHKANKNSRNKPNYLFHMYGSAGREAWSHFSALQRTSGEQARLP